ncbi:MAG: hypothetical protein SGI71_02020 [Verrucomicrobiota bacterium]|nr:hypothetical protein [Verrucomicrobiota bacterium]
MRVPLDENTVVVVPTAKNRTTTISFYRPIDVIDGAGFTVDPAQVKGDFLLSFSPGNKVFSVTPLVDGANRNINVVVDGRVLPFEMVPVSHGKRPLMSVIVDSIDSSLSTIVKSSQPPPGKLKSAGAAQLIGLLDRLKLISVVSNQEDMNSLVRKMPETTAAIVNNDPVDYGSHLVSLRKVMRDSRLDALAFEFEIENVSEIELLLDVESLGVRAGNNIYAQVIVDVHPVLAAGQRTLGWCAIVGTPNGSPNHLSVANDFTIVLGLLNNSAPLPLPTEDVNEKDLEPLTHTSDPKPTHHEGSGIALTQSVEKPFTRHGSKEGKR